MQPEIAFVENRPLDTDVLAQLLSDRADLHLVWPAATWPFDPDHWRQALAPDQGHRSHFARDGAPCSSGGRSGRGPLECSPESSGKDTAVAMGKSLGSVPPEAMRHPSTERMRSSKESSGLATGAREARSARRADA